MINARQFIKRYYTINLNVKFNLKRTILTGNILHVLYFIETLDGKNNPPNRRIFKASIPTTVPVISYLKLSNSYKIKNCLKYRLKIKTNPSGLFFT